MRKTLKSPKKKAVRKKRPSVSLQVYRIITLRILDEVIRCGVGTKNEQRQPVYAFIAGIIIGRLLKANKGDEVKEIIGQYRRMPAFKEFQLMLQDSAILRNYESSEFLP